jgi:hypothetical protein
MAVSKYESENPRTIYNTPLAELQKQFLSEDAHEVYHYIYCGKVLSNSDPLKQGRLKIQIINFFDNLTVDEIPWAYPVQPIVDGAFSIPEVGQYLEVFFDHGEIYSPKYIGHALNLNQIPSKLSENYPNTIVIFQTKTGNYSTLNRITGEFKIVQSTGAKIVIKPSGEIDVESPTFINIKSPFVKIEHQAGAVVLPDASGGPYCALPLDPITGSLHQGQLVSNT